MSYTTQRDFFNVSFRNEDPKLPERKRSDGAIMTYEFCSDGRAWALDKEKRSNYILDVVHKARFKKALLHPEGQFELTKDYLIHLDVEDLADYILSLQGEVQRKNQTIQKLEQSQQSLGEQLETVQKQSEDFFQIQRQSAILEQERVEFEQQMSDLEAVIVNLKDRADRYDVLAQENELLRCQIQNYQIEATDRMRLITAEAEANFNRMRAEDCEALEAELSIFKARYDDLRQQKRELKEQLQKALVCQTKLAELKRGFALEQAQREKVEEEMEHLLALYDKQSQELHRKSGYIIAANQQMESIRYDIQDQLLPAIEEPMTEKSYYRDSTKPTNSVELIVDSCENCKKMEAELVELRNSQIVELDKREELSRSLQTDLETLRKELAGMTALQEASLAESGEQSNLLADQLKKCHDDLKTLTDRERSAQENQEAETVKSGEQANLLADQLEKCQNELRTQTDKEASAQAQVAALETDMLQLQAKLADESKKLEQTIAQMETVQSQADKLHEELSLKNAALAVSGTDDTQILDLQSQLEEARNALTEKIEQLDKIVAENTQLQSTVSSFQAKIENLEEEQQLNISELEASRSELARTKELGDPDSNILELQEQLDLARKELTEKIEQLDAITAENTQLQSTVSDFQATFGTLEEAQQLELNNEKPESADEQQKSGELDITDLDVLQKLNDELQKEVSILRAELAVAQDYAVELNDEPDQVELLMTIEKLKAELEAVTDTAKAKEAEIANLGVENSAIRSTQGLPSTLNPETELGGMELTGSRMDVEEAPLLEGRNLPVADGQDENARINESVFIDDDIIGIGSSDPDKTRRIAIKIVRHGINILIVAELDHLHREICRAIIERYLMLGQNVTAIDTALDTCHHILNGMKTMQGSEMMSMVDTAVQSPLRNPPLLEDELPVRLPRESKPRAKSTNSPLPNEAQVFATFARNVAPSLVQAPVKKSNGRVLVGEYNTCRTRPWRAPKTPTETFVACTLADGSRLETRQKRFL